MKKIAMIFLSLALILPMIGPAQAADVSVCGLDGNTYVSVAAAETAGAEVSYNGACVAVSTEAGLAEQKTNLNFVGALVELGSTDLPTRMIIRNNGDKIDYVVAVASTTIFGPRRDQLTSLSDWIPGDQIRIVGKKNENTSEIEASVAANLSIKASLGANGWITKIDTAAKKIFYQYNNKELSFAYDDQTRFLVGAVKTLADIKVGDRIRVRLLRRASADPLAKIVVVLRRGTENFMKMRTYAPLATLVRLDSAVVPTTIQIKFEKTPGLKAGDANNLLGTEGKLITVNITADTKIVRKYLGQAALGEFAVGDKVQVIGRFNDDGTMDAKVLKDNSIWRVNTSGHAGIVTEVNSAAKYLMMDWTPVKQMTKAKLKIKLKEKAAGLSAQALGSGIMETLGNLAESLRNRIKNSVQEKVGKFERRAVYKKVKVDRIKAANTKLKDLIERKAVKNIKVEVSDQTKIVVGTNTGAALSDIKAGDKIRVRGVYRTADNKVVAETIVVVNSLPEIEESLETPIDDINEVVSEITTQDTSTAVVETTVSDTEVVVSAE